MTDTLTRIAATALLALLGAIPATASELTPHEAEYRVDLGLISGRLTTHLEAKDDRLIATHSVEPRGAIRIFTRGSIREQSTFTTGSVGVIPLHYVSNDSLSSDKVRAEVDFDYDFRRLTGSIIQDGTEAPVDVGLDTEVFDRVSIQYQLMSDLLNGRDTEHYVLYDIDEFKPLIISRVGSRTIEVKAGTFDAVGIQHQSEGSSRVTTLWCAAELDYLPILIEQHRKGELKVRATLSRYQRSNN